MLGYEVQEVIGRGSYGIIRRVVDVQTQIAYARKEIQPDFLEVDLLSRFLHPNIIFLHHFWLDDAMDRKSQDSSLYLILELGSNNLEDQASYCPDHIYTMINVIFFLHQNGAIHGDVKLSNFVETASGLKLIDFSLSSYRDSPVYHCQSMDVAPPEILDLYSLMDLPMAKSYESMMAADLWALGVTILLYLTHETTFDIKSYLAHPKLYLADHHIKLKWQPLLLWLLELDPSIRLQNRSKVQAMYGRPIASLPFDLPPLVLEDRSDIRSLNHDAKHLFQLLRSKKVEVEVVFLSLDLFYRSDGIYDRYLPNQYRALACSYLAIQLSSSRYMDRIIQWCQQEKISMQDMIEVATCIAIALKGKLYTPNLYTGIDDYTILASRLPILTSLEDYIQCRPLLARPAILSKFHASIGLF